VAAGADDRVRADAPLEALLGSESLRRVGALMAVDADGRLRGVVTMEQVTRALQSRLSAA
jgi:xanthine/CO dehydrogenase XdhC/CoxF family maturation factor